MNPSRRFLPLFTPDENWIERPDLYLLARMGSEDGEEEGVVRQVYEVMCRSDGTRTELDSFGKTVERHHIRQKLSERLAAAHVVLELVRIAATTGKPPSEAKALRLAAFNHHKTFRKSSLESLERNFRRGFSAYRNTAHLQAAMVLQEPSILAIEGSVENTVRFLSRARGLERFMDNNLAGGSFKWSPWRVPPRIPITSDISVKRLTIHELMLIGTAPTPG